MKVIYYLSCNGDNPVSDFLDSLTTAQQSKILRIFSYIKSYGIQSVIPHIKKLAGTNLWEIRVVGKDNIRILYVVPSNDFVLVLHGFIKKTQKTDKRQLITALNRYNEWNNKVHSLDK